MLSGRACLTLTILCALAATPGCAHQGYPAGFGADEIRQLQELPMPIAVPEYVPPGFKLARVKIGRRGNFEYSLTYTTATGRRFIFGGVRIKQFVRSDLLTTTGVPRTLAKGLGSPDDVKTDGGCTLATSLPFKPGRNGLVFTVFGCAKDIRPGEVVRIFESAQFINS